MCMYVLMYILCVLLYVNFIENILIRINVENTYNVGNISFLDY